jgi:hypothetical protein
MSTVTTDELPVRDFTLKPFDHVAFIMYDILYLHPLGQPNKHHGLLVLCALPN